MTPAFRCPRCGRVSYHPRDYAEEYCGACHDWTAAPAEGRRCRQGHVMIQSNSFRFDHEAGDEPSVRESLTRFRQMGIKLGATVTVWSCDSCNVIEAIFTSPPAGPSA